MPCRDQPVGAGEVGGAEGDAVDEIRASRVEVIEALLLTSGATTASIPSESAAAAAKNKQTNPKQLTFARERRERGGGEKAKGGCCRAVCVEVYTCIDLYGNESISTSTRWV